MSERNSEDWKRTAISLLAGVGAGVLMAVILLFVVQSCGFPLWNLSFWIILLIACGLPQWCDFFRFRGYSYVIIESVMVAVSFGIFLLYAFQVSEDIPTRDTISTIAVLIHAAAGIVIFARAMFRARKKKECGERHV